ncbi:MAG: HAD family hydrolase [Acutalibacteraceae bacterium]
MYKAVIFDLDGTLLNTLSDLAASVNYALKSCGYPERTIKEVRAFIGNGVIKLMQRATPDGISQQSFDRCFEAFRSHYLEHMFDTTKPYDGILPLLDALKTDGIKTSVVSNKLHSGVVGLCKDFFGDRLTCAFGVLDESERKPSPANVFKALEYMNVDAGNCVYVGDSEVDVQTANNAGLDCIAVTWGYRDIDVLKLINPKYIIDSPEEILEIIK